MVAICAFVLLGCSHLWPLFVHLPFWVLSFVAAICAFALLCALFCGHYLCICPFGLLSFVYICAFGSSLWIGPLMLFLPFSHFHSMQVASIKYCQGFTNSIIFFFPFLFCKTFKHVSSHICKPTTLKWFWHARGPSRCHPLILVSQWLSDLTIEWAWFKMQHFPSILYWYVKIACSSQ